MFTDLWTRYKHNVHSLLYQLINQSIHEPSSWKKQIQMPFRLETDSIIFFSERLSHCTGVNPARDARDTYSQYFGWGTSVGIFPPILLRAFGYSRPILVVLAQWQHLMTSFIHCFARTGRLKTRNWTSRDHQNFSMFDFLLSGLAMSTLATWSRVVHPCYPVPRCQVSRCPVPRFQRPRLATGKSPTCYRLVTGKLV